MSGAAMDKIAPEHRWTGSLDELWSHLKREAWRAKGRPAWVILPRGACVSLRVLPSFRRELRIARPEAPKDAGGYDLWEREITTFLNHFPPATPFLWARRDDPSAPGIAAVFVEVQAGEMLTPGGAIVAMSEDG